MLWLKEPAKGTTTNANGEFTLKNVDDGAMLEISSMGYETRGVNVNGKRSILSVPLSKATSQLDDVQMYCMEKLLRDLILAM